MSDEFDQVFGARRPSFAERVGREPSPDPQPTPPEGAVSSEPYKPYGFLPTGNVGESCDVQRWIENTEIAEGIEFQYRFLMQIGYVGEEQLKLFLPDCIVVIEGRFLRELRKKLARRMVTFIQQYNPRIWAMPGNGEMVITRIDVVRPDAAKR